jgi:glucose-6-phosphate 1-dehydrogenase
VRAGKCLAKTLTEVSVELKRPPPVVFSETPPRGGNVVRFRVGPDVAITLDARTKVPGEGMTGRPVTLAVTEAPESHDASAYVRLLNDAMSGDATLFARQDVVEAAWAIVEPAIHTTSMPIEYDPGTWGPLEAEDLVVDVGGWNTRG